MLLLLPYVLVPLSMTLMWRKLKLPPYGTNLLVTLFTIAVYPFFMMQPDEYMHPTGSEGPRCGIMYGAFVWINFLIMVPVSLALQVFFDYCFIARKKRK